MLAFSFALPDAFSALRQKIADLYGAALPDGFVIKYEDEEKDLISVTSDLELQEVRIRCRS